MEMLLQVISKGLELRVLKGDFWALPAGSLCDQQVVFMEQAGRLR